MKLVRMSHDTFCVPGQSVYRLFITHDELTLYPGNPDAPINTFVRVSVRGLTRRKNVKTWSAK